MVSRRDFLFTAAAGASVAALSGILPATAMATANAAAPATSGPSLQQSDRTAGGRYRPPYRIGQGGAPLGGSSNIAVSDEDAVAILKAAWLGGMRYYDTSPWYGLGLSERRFGHLLHGQDRESFVLSTKVGRILTGTDTPPKTMWAKADSFAYKYDYSASATRRSVEDSLQRLGVPSLDIVFIHDLSPDNGDMGEKWTEYFDQAAKGAMPELTRMREEGLIKAWGFGVNTLPPILKALEQGDPDIFLAACQYSLMDHAQSLEKLFPACDAKGVSVVVGAPLNNGFLAGRDRFNYQGTIPDGYKEKRTRIQNIAQSHGTDLRTAALHFCAAPATVSSVIPGARKAAQPGQNVKSMQNKIPADFWAELKSEKLIAQNAPVPS